MAVRIYKKGLYQVSEAQLKEIRGILQVTVSLTQQCREDIVELTQTVKTNTANIDRLSEKLNQLLQQTEEERRVLTSEIRGIRLEVQRVLEHVFGQQNEQD